MDGRETDKSLGHGGGVEARWWVVSPRRPAGVQGREVEGQSVHGLPAGWQSLLRGSRGERYQVWLFQGVLRRREPAMAGTGQKRSQCWTELSPAPHKTQGWWAQACSEGGRIRESDAIE